MAASARSGSARCAPQVGAACGPRERQRSPVEPTPVHRQRDVCLATTVCPVTSEIVVQLVLGVGSSVITGAGVWLVQRLRATGRTRRRRRFLGVPGLVGGASRLVVGEHY